MSNKLVCVHTPHALVGTNLNHSYYMYVNIHPFTVYIIAIVHLNLTTCVLSTTTIPYCGVVSYGIMKIDAHN